MKPDEHQLVESRSLHRPEVESRHRSHSDHAKPKHPKKESRTRDEHAPVRDTLAFADPSPPPLAEPSLSAQSFDVNSDRSGPRDEPPSVFVSPDTLDILQFTITISEPPPRSGSRPVDNGLANQSISEENGDGRNTADGGESVTNTESAERSNSDARSTENERHEQPRFVITGTANPASNGASDVDRAVDSTSAIDYHRVDDVDNDPRLDSSFGDPNRSSAGAIDHVFETLSPPSDEHSILRNQDQVTGEDRDWKLNRETLLRLKELKETESQRQAPAHHSERTEAFQEWFDGPGGFIELDNHESELVLGEIGIEAFDIPLDATLGSHRLLRLASLAPQSSEDTAIRDAILAAIAGEQNDQAEPVVESTLARHRTSLWSGAVLAAGTIAYVVKRSVRKRHPKN